MEQNTRSKLSNGESEEIHLPENGSTILAGSFQSASWTNGVTTAVPLPVRTITYDANGATSGNVVVECYFRRGRK